MGGTGELFVAHSILNKQILRQEAVRVPLLQPTENTERRGADEYPTGYPNDQQREAIVNHGGSWRRSLAGIGRHTAMSSRSDPWRLVIGWIFEQPCDDELDDSGRQINREFAKTPKDHVAIEVASRTAKRRAAGSPGFAVIDG